MESTDTYLIVLIALLLFMFIFQLFALVEIADLLREIKACQCGG